jgi:hypothetical protein
MAGGGAEDAEKSWISGLGRRSNWLRFARRGVGLLRSEADLTAERGWRDPQPLSGMLSVT